MHADLKIVTLGGLAITLGDAPVVGLASRKAEALLVYLACQPQPHPRDALADLLWDGISTERARGNLSVLLTSLRQQLGGYLSITRQNITFNKSQPHWLDASAFETKTQERITNNQDPSGSSWVSALESNLSLYHGDFLHGFVIKDSPRFEEWLLSEQTRLRQIAGAMRRRLIAHYVDCGDDEAGITHATALLQHDGLDEEAHRWLMLLLARSGQRSAALAQFETCRNALQIELGIEPSEQTLALVERIRGNVLGLSNSPVLSINPISREPALRNVPFQPTSFIGREAELAHIAEKLANPNCRLLSLVGPGGMGKTRLALEGAQRQAATLRHGGAFVPLAPLASTNRLAGAIGQALGATLPGQQAAEAELLAYLHDRQLLLLLDNAEHLPKASELVQQILAHAPEVCVLVTSREPLHLQAEWLFDVHGLDYPGDDAQWVGSLVGTQGLEAFSALRLFVERAQRAQAGFALNKSNALPAIRICQWVDGLPLGIELAAAWVHVVPCARIADEIARNDDFLATKAQDVPQRHRSLRAVFDHSWKLLNAAPRGLLPKLAVFRGGFDLDAAVGVCDESRRSIVSALSTLVDKSLLRCDADGRYELHELVRQFALEKLEAKVGGANEVRRRHSGYYLGWLHRNESRLVGLQQNEVLQAIGLEIDNVRAAWLWAVEHKDAPLLGQALHSLYLFLDIRNRFQEAHDLMEQAIVALQGTRDLAGLAVLARLLARQGKLCERLGQYQQGWDCLQRSLQLAQRLEDASEIAYALDGLAHIKDRQGDYEAARTFLDESLKLYREVGDDWGIATVLHNMASAAEGLQKYSEAQKFIEESLSIRRTLNDGRGMAFGYNLLGIVTEMRQDYAQATQAYHASLDIFRALNDRLGMSLVLSNLGDVSETLGKYAAAHEHYLNALCMAIEIGSAPSMLTYVVKIGILLTKTGTHERAAELLGLSIAHGATEQAFKDRAQRALDELSAYLSPQVMAAAHARGEVRSLEDVARELVATDANWMQGFVEHNL